MDDLIQQRTFVLKEFEGCFEKAELSRDFKLEERVSSKYSSAKSNFKNFLVKWRIFKNFEIPHKSEERRMLICR